MTNLQEIVDNYNGEDKKALIDALLVREDGIRDQLYLAGQQFNLYPFIVAEVIATVGLGTPPTNEEREMIRQNYKAGVENLIAQQQQQPPPDQPPPAGV